MNTVSQAPRRVRFSLGTLLLLTAMAGLASVWLQEQAEHSRTRNRLVELEARNQELHQRIRDFQQLVPDPARRQLRAQGRFEEALEAFQGALHVQTRDHGPRHPETLDSQFYVGELYSLTGQLDPAANHLQTYLDTAPPSGTHYTVALSHLGEIRRRQGRLAEAEELQRRCVSIRSQTHADNWLLFISMSNLGGCLLEQGKYQDAEPFLVDGYEGLIARESRIWTEVRGRHITKATRRLAQLYDQWGKLNEAAAWKQELQRVESKYPNP